MTRITTGQYHAIIKKKKPKNKYGNKITEYNGRKYHSKKEAAYAAELDMLLNAKNDDLRVVEWQPQVKYDLVVKGTVVGHYVLDFLVRYADGRTEYIDIKAKDKNGKFLTTNEYRLKKNLMKAIYDIDIIEQ